MRRSIEFLTRENELGRRKFWKNRRVKKEMVILTQLLKSTINSSE